MSDATNNLAVAEQFAKVTRQGDVAGYIAMAEEDAVTWHNFDCTEVNRDRSAETLRWLHLTSPDVTWTDVALTLSTARPVGATAAPDLVKRVAVDNEKCSSSLSSSSSSSSSS